MKTDVTYLKDPTEWEIAYFEAAQNLAAAHVRYSQAFQTAKTLQKASDKLAEQVAIEATGGEIPMYEAVLHIARVRMETRAS